MTRKEYARKGQSATTEADKYAENWRSGRYDGPIVCPYSFELYSDSIRVEALELEQKGGGQ